MTDFTLLERAVLREIIRQYPAEKAILEAQLATAIVRGRDNTGAGFYTNFEVDPTAARATSCERIVGNVWATIQGFSEPMTFLMFIEEGHANCLEGAAVADSTSDIDLETIKFQICSA